MKALGLLIVLAGCFRGGEAQFPRVCTSDSVLKSMECCPTPPGFPEPCGGPGRGRCENIPDPTVEEDIVTWNDAYNYDDRGRWPTKFFNRSCVCEGKFSGYDCTKCIWGYRGENCETKQKTAVRKNIKNLSSDEKEKFQRYLDLAKNTVSDIVFPTKFLGIFRGIKSKDFVNVSVYDSFVALHYYASRFTMPPAISGLCRDSSECFFDYAHEAVGFPTWHRKILLEIERAVQEVNSDPDWTLPYWDWSAAEENQCDICTNEYVGANDEDGNLDPGSIFASWWTICEHLPEWEESVVKFRTTPCDVSNNTYWHLKRNPGTQDTAYFGESMAFLPSAEEVDFAMRFPVYDTPPYIRYSNCSFRNLLEGFADTSTGKNHENGNVVVFGAHTLHNQVHIYMNGTMGENPTSPNDPIFFLHHCNVDRLLETWMRLYPVVESALPERGTPPGHNRNDYMVPFFPPRSHATMFKRSTEFGYDYEEFYEDPTDGNDMGECSAAVPDREGVSPEAIGLGVGIGTLKIMQQQQLSN
ncbi:PREDICTED: tyrosinase-like [Branchiostoma belcheri]|uniref:Tyrosinase n=1 Tax=Branchiostoma belcheri TaxID=7741 RepID=A0A6P4YV80_BRABE|nr:PREDICTED: tyrosinase-like [Branchiostoma belcheri]